jgi:hypothetical protein
MADYDYSFNKLWITASSHTARLGVLWPAIGNKSGGLKTTEGQLFALPGLLKLWRDRAKELCDEGWQKLTKAKYLQYARNCMPALAHVSLTANEGKMGRTCKLWDICPWCYSRWLISIYRKTRTHLTNDDKLVYVRLEHIERFQTVPPTSELRKLLSKYRTLTGKLAFANSKTCKGIYWTVALAPALRDPTGVIIYCGLIAIVPKVETFDLVPGDWTAEEYPAKVGWKETVRAVSRAFHYPTGLLKGNPAMAYAILVAREKLRLTDSYGCFRGTVRDD